MRSTARAKSAGIAIVGLLIATVWVACGSMASGSFKPKTPDTLTVATAQIPDPGFWTGTAEHPTGGFEFGLAKALAAHFGLARVRVVQVPFARLVEGDLGGADLALSDITITKEREQHVDFSTPYLRAPPAIVVRPGTPVPDVNTAKSLHWAVQSGTTLQSALAASIEPSTETQVLPHQREVLLALRVRRADAVMLDLPVALAYADASPKDYEVAAQLRSEDELGAALPQGSGNLEAVDSALRTLSSDGTLERLGREWLHADLHEGGSEQVPVLRSEE